MFAVVCFQGSGSSYWICSNLLFYIAHIVSTNIAMVHTMVVTTSISSFNCNLSVDRCTMVFAFTSIFIGACPQDVHRLRGVASRLYWVRQQPVETECVGYELCLLQTVDDPCAESNVSHLLSVRW